MLRRELAAFTVGEQFALGNTKQGVVRFVVIARSEERFVGCDQRDTARVGEFNENVFSRSFRGHAVALQFYVEPIAEQALQLVAACDSERALTGDDRNVERTVGAARERDQSIRRALEPGKLDMGAFMLLGLEISARRQPHEAPVTVLAGGQQDKVRPPFPGHTVAVLLIAEVDAQRAADNRLNTRARHFLGKLERAEHVIGIGESERRLAVLFGELGQPRNGQRAFEQGVGRMHVQMHEARLFCGSPIGSRHRA